MLVLIFLLSVQLGTYGDPIVVPTDPRCDNVPNHNYDLDQDLLCIESDLIFKNGFDN